MVQQHDDTVQALFTAELGQEAARRPCRLEMIWPAAATPQPYLLLAVRKSSLNARRTNSISGDLLGSVTSSATRRAMGIFPCARHAGGQQAQHIISKQLQNSAPTLATSVRVGVLAARPQAAVKKVPVQDVYDVAHVMAWAFTGRTGPPP